MNFDKLYPLLEKALNESPYRGWKMDKESVRVFAETITPNNGLLVVEASPSGEYIGVLAAMITTGHPLLTANAVATEMMWYVDPAYRNGKVGHRMLKRYEEWAKEMGCKYSVVSHYVDETGSTVGKLYERNKYKAIEVSYLKELE